MRCVIANDSHIVKEPVLASCGHGACKLCVSKLNNLKQSTCKVCNKIVKFDLNILDTSLIFQKNIQNNIESLMISIKNNLFDSFYSLKGMIIYDNIV